MDCPLKNGSWAGAGGVLGMGLEKSWGREAGENVFVEREDGGFFMTR